jgi:hypothetical protein
MGPTASSVSPVCRLGQGDIARLSCKQSLIFGGVYHDKAQERSHLTSAMSSILGVSLPLTGGLEGVWRSLEWIW